MKQSNESTQPGRLTVIADSIAEAFYGVPEELKCRLGLDLRGALERFNQHMGR